MAAGGQVADLFAKLGLRPDKGEWDKGDKLISGMKTALAGLAAYASVSFLKGQINDTVALGGKLNDMSVATGASAESLQKLGYASGLAGGGLDVVNTLLKKTNINAYAAVKGNTDLAQAYRKVGLSTAQLKKLKPDEILEAVGAGLASIGDSKERAALAVKLLGKSGADSLPFLTSDIKAAGEEAVALGAVISNDGVAALDDFGDNTDKLHASVTGLRNQIVVALIPTLNKLVKGATEWVKANRKVIASGVEKFARALISALQLVAQGVAALIKVLDWLASHLGVVALAVGSLVVAILILKAASIQAAIASAAAWVASLLPFLALAAVIAAVILIVEDLYNAFTGGESVFKDLYLSAKSWIGDKLYDLIQGAGYLVDKFLGRDTYVDEIDKANAKALEAGRQKSKGTILASDNRALEIARRNAYVDQKQAEIRAAQSNPKWSKANIAASNEQIKGLDKLRIQPSSIFEAATGSLQLTQERLGLRAPPAITLTTTVDARGATSPGEVASKTAQATGGILQTALRQAMPVAAR